MARRKQEPSKMDVLIDDLLKDRVDAEDLFGQDGLLNQLKKRMAEHILETELTDHLGYVKDSTEGRIDGNICNGRTTKTLKDEKGKIDIPRDRRGSFDPKLIRKYQTRWPDFDDKIITMYARGMTTRELATPYRKPLRRGHLARTGLQDHRQRSR